MIYNLNSVVRTQNNHDGKRRFNDPTCACLFPSKRDEGPRNGTVGAPREPSCARGDNAVANLLRSPVLRLHALRAGWGMGPDQILYAVASR